ncbi:hypothetical protein Bca101_021806 [Brassica carinata]
MLLSMPMMVTTPPSCLRPPPDPPLSLCLNAPLEGLSPVISPEPPDPPDVTLLQMLLSSHRSSAHHVPFRAGSHHSVAASSTLLLVSAASPLGVGNTEVSQLEGGLTESGCSHLFESMHRHPDLIPATPPPPVRVTTGRETSSPLRSRASPRPPLFTVSLPPLDCCCSSNNDPTPPPHHTAKSLSPDTISRSPDIVGCLGLAHWFVPSWPTGLSHRKHVTRFEACLVKEITNLSMQSPQATLPSENPDPRSFNQSLSEFDDWQFGASSAKPSWFLHGNAGTRSSCLNSLLVAALEVLVKPPYIFNVVVLVIYSLLDSHSPSILVNAKSSQTGLCIPYGHGASHQELLSVIVPTVSYRCINVVFDYQFALGKNMKFLHGLSIPLSLTRPLKALSFDVL